MGNIRSVQNALAYLGKDSQVSSDPRTIAESEKLILPGVGSFRTAMQNLLELGIVEALHEAVIVKGRPVLGICLGMQLLAQEGTEDGITNGLGWIPGRVVRFELTDPSYRVPHIGFNSVRFVQGGNVLFRNMGERLIFILFTATIFPAAMPDMYRGGRSTGLRSLQAYSTETYSGPSSTRKRASQTASRS